jgi:hypothetical protein
MLTNSEQIQSLKGKYAGRRCFIMGNGPSLNRTRLELLKDEIVWSFNKIYLLFEKITWRPKFYVTNDQRLTRHISKEIDALISQLPDSIFFFPDHFLSNEVNNKNGNVYWYHEIPWNDQDSNSSTLFSRDPSKFIVNTATVTIAGLQLAAYLGFNPIHLIGCDTSYTVPASVKFEDGNPEMLTSTVDDDPNHFAPGYSGKGDKWSAPNVPLMITQYMDAQRALEETNIKVYNATVGGYLEVFPRVDFASLFGQSQELPIVHPEI